MRPVVRDQQTYSRVMTALEGQPDMRRIRTEVSGLSRADIERRRSIILRTDATQIFRTSPVGLRTGLLAIRTKASPRRSADVARTGLGPSIAINQGQSTAACSHSHCVWLLFGPFDAIRIRQRERMAHRQDIALSFLCIFLRGWKFGRAAVPSRPDGRNSRPCRYSPSPIWM